MQTIILSIGSFLLILALLVLLRSRNSKFEVKPSDIVVAVLPVIVSLQVTGRLQKFETGESGVKIETAFVKASESAIISKVTPLTGLSALTDAVTLSLGTDGVANIERVTGQEKSARSNMT